MDVREAIINRKSMRKFKDETLSDEQLNSLKKAIQLAPSASNRQPYRFILVKDRELLKILRKKAIYQKFIENCAVFIVGLGLPDGNPWYKIDVAIALQHVALQAVEIGLGTCWIGAFDQRKAKSAG